MLEKIKVALRVSTAYFDEEIEGLMLACKKDLQIAGVEIDETDSLYQRAVTLYCKTHFGYDNKDSDKFQKAYDSLKLHLAHSLDYRSDA